MADSTKIERHLNIKGLNLYTNPLLKQNGELLRAVNVVSEPYGAKSQRPGYVTYLGTADGSVVTSLFSWTKDDGTTLFTYRASGVSLFSSAQGTGAWTLCGNGTITASAHVGYAVLGNTLMVCDGAGSTRYSTSGTSFTNGTLAPVAVDLVEYQRRIYAAGTASTLFYSTTNDATNWNTSGTSDSSSFTIPNAGKLSRIYTVADRLIAAKNSGRMYKWDGYSLIDMATDAGPSSPYSVSSTEGYYFWLNRKGVFGYGGVKPELLSNVIQPMIYNNAGGGISGAGFGTAPATSHIYDFMLACGSVTDDLTNENIPRAVIDYNYQKNEFLTHNFANAPTAFHSFKNADGQQQLIFGDSSGQCYTYGGTAVADNGSPIESIIEGVIDLNQPELDKKFQWFWGFFNPGCEVSVSAYIGNTYSTDSKRYVNIGTPKDGLLETTFPTSSRGKFLFYKVTNASTTKGFTFYGACVQAEVIGQ